MDAFKGRNQWNCIGNLKTFLYGILGLKYSWMLIKAENENIEAHHYRKSHDKISPAMRLIRNRMLEGSKDSCKNKGSMVKVDTNSKGFYTLNLFNTSPLRLSISSAIQNAENQTKGMHSGSRSPSVGSMSSQIGDSVGIFNSEGKFYFSKKVEIRKINMHYKMFSDNRAKHVRFKKLEKDAKRSDEKSVKTKVDHKKYLMKQSKPNNSKIPIVPNQKSHEKLVKDYK